MNQKDVQERSNGDVYEGDQMYDVGTANGTCKYANNDVYEGDWKNDVQHGKGIY